MKRRSCRCSRADRPAFKLLRLPFAARPGSRSGPTMQARIRPIISTGQAKSLPTNIFVAGKSGQVSFRRESGTRKRSWKDAIEAEDCLRNVASSLCISSFLSWLHISFLAGYDIDAVTLTPFIRPDQHFLRPPASAQPASASYLARPLRFLLCYICRCHSFAGRRIMATPGFRDRARNRSPTRPFSTTVALADLSEEESIPSTASIGVRRSASRGHLRPRLDANGRAIVVESETIRKVFGGEASDEEMAPSSSRQMPQSRNLRGLGIDTANAAARGASA